MVQKQELKQSIDEWHRHMLYVRNESIAREKVKLPPQDFALALVGVRRSGKTYKAIQASLPLLAEKVLYYNFEDPLFITDNSVALLDRLIATAQEYRSSPIELLILDEIQNVMGWERWLRKIIDQKLFRVIVTGSSASLLGSELATSLTGRCLEYRVWPLSFSEFCNFKNIDRNASRLNLLACMREYMTWGSLPEVVKQGDEELKKKILLQYLGDIVHRDVVNRHSIRNKRVLDQILTYYLTNISSLHSYNALSKAFSTTVDTASEYSRVLEDAFLIFEMSRYHQNFKVQTRDPKKVYSVDTGLWTAVSRSIHDDSTRLLENIVCVELRRREKEVSYFKERYELDFIVSENYKPVEAIQVCYDLSDPVTRERELRALGEGMDVLGLNRGSIISYDHEERLNIDGKNIDIVPIYTWLS